VLYEIFPNALVLDLLLKLISVTDHLMLYMDVDTLIWLVLFQYFHSSWHQF